MLWIAATAERHSRATRPSGRTSSHSQRGCSFLLVLCARVGGDFTELFEGGFEVFDSSTRSTGWPWVLARGPFGLRLRARRRPERSESRHDDFLGEDVKISNITPAPPDFRLPLFLPQPPS